MLRPSAERLPCHCGFWRSPLISALACSDPVTRQPGGMIQRPDADVGHAGVDLAGQRGLLGPGPGAVLLGQARAQLRSQGAGAFAVPVELGLHVVALGAHAQAGLLDVGAHAGAAHGMRAHFTRLAGARPRGVDDGGARAVFHGQAQVAGGTLDQQFGLERGAGGVQVPAGVEAQIAAQAHGGQRRLLGHGQGINPGQRQGLGAAGAAQGPAAVAALGGAGVVPGQQHGLRRLGIGAALGQRGRRDLQAAGRRRERGGQHGTARGALGDLHGLLARQLHLPRAGQVLAWIQPGLQSVDAGLPVQGRGTARRGKAGLQGRVDLRGLRAALRLAGEGQAGLLGRALECQAQFGQLQRLLGRRVGGQVAQLGGLQVGLQLQAAGGKRVAHGGLHALLQCAPSAAPAGVQLGLAFDQGAGQRVLHAGQLAQPLCEGGE